MGVSTIAAASLLGLVACANPPRTDCDQAHPIRTHCGFENPEDLASVPGQRAVVVSQMRRGETGGTLVSWMPDGGGPRRLWPLEATPGIVAGPTAGDPACPPPEPEEFAPHGVFIAPSGLYVVNHGGRESVEIFGLGGVGAELRARWLGCVELPPETSGNDVAVGPTGEILVSNTSPPGGMLVASLRSRLGLPTGDLRLWRAGSGWHTVPNTRASVPNGVALSPDGKWLYYAEAGAERVVRIRPDGSERSEGTVRGRPDNLNWSEDGTLYVASHLSFLELARCLWSRPCRAPWEVFELDPETLEARSVLAHDGERLGAVAAAEPVAGDVYLSAVFGDRIGVWSPRGAAR